MTKANIDPKEENKQEQKLDIYTGHICRDIESGKQKMVTYYRAAKDFKENMEEQYLTFIEGLISLIDMTKPKIDAICDEKTAITFNNKVLELLKKKAHDESKNEEFFNKIVKKFEDYKSEPDKKIKNLMNDSEFTEANKSTLKESISGFMNTFSDALSMNPKDLFGMQDVNPKHIMTRITAQKIADQQLKMTHSEKGVFIDQMNKIAILWDPVTSNNKVKNQLVQDTGKFINKSIENVVEILLKASNPEERISFTKHFITTHKKDKDLNLSLDKVVQIVMKASNPEERISFTKHFITTHKKDKDLTNLIHAIPPNVLKETIKFMEPKELVLAKAKDFDGTIGRFIESEISTRKSFLKSTIAYIGNIISNIFAGTNDLPKKNPFHAHKEFKLFLTNNEGQVAENDKKKVSDISLENVSINKNDNVLKKEPKDVSIDKHTLRDLHGAIDILKKNSVAKDRNTSNKVKKNKVSDKIDIIRG